MSERERQLPHYMYVYIIYIYIIYIYISYIYIHIYVYVYAYVPVCVCILESTLKQQEGDRHAARARSPTETEQFLRPKTDKTGDRTGQYMQDCNQQKLVKNDAGATTLGSQTISFMIQDA